MNQIEYDYILSFILKLKEKKNFKNSQIYFIAERNMGYNSDWISGFLVDKFKHNITIFKDKTEKNGINTNEILKSLMISGICYLLSTKKLILHKDILCVTTDEITTENALEEFRRQLLSFEKVIDIKGNNKKILLTGKHNGYDDMVMALGLLCYGFKKMKYFSKYAN